MAANPTGELEVKAGGKSYRLHFGMSVIADLQAKYGDKLEAVLSPKPNAKMPDLGVVMAIFHGALKRYHPEVADDRWLVDDIVAENQDLLPRLLAASSSDPDEAAAEGNGQAAA